MSRPRVRALALLGLMVIGGSVLAGCGGSGGGTTTTATPTATTSPDDGTVTIQTDTVVRTTPATTTTGTGTGTTSKALDAAIADAEGVVSATLAEVRAQIDRPDATAAAQALTALTARFDRAVDQIKAVVASGEAERAIQDAVVAYGQRLSDDYRAYVEAAVAAADSNSTRALVAKGEQFLSALAGFANTTG